MKSVRMDCSAPFRVSVIVYVCLIACSCNTDDCMSPTPGENGPAESPDVAETTMAMTGQTGSMLRSGTLSLIQTPEGVVPSVTSNIPFGFRSSRLVLVIAGATFALDHYKAGTDRHTSVFPPISRTLFDSLKDGAPVSVRYDDGIGIGLDAFVTLDKTTVEVL